MREAKSGRDNDTSTQLEDVSRRLGVTESATTAFLAILGEKRVPAELLVETFVRIATTHKAMQQKLESLSTNDEAVQQLRNRATAQIKIGQYHIAEQVLDEADHLSLHALEKARLDLVGRARDAAQTRASKADLQLVQLNYATSFSLLLEAAQLAKSYDSGLEADYTFRAGQIAIEMQEWGGAAAAFERVITLAQAELQVPVEALIRYRTFLAMAKVRLGATAEARSLYYEALAYYRRAGNAEAANAGRTLNSLAALFVDQGDFRAGLKGIQEAIAVGRPVLGRYHSDIAVWANSLGQCRLGLGQRRAARRLYNMAIKIDTRTVGLDHPAAVRHSANLGGVLLELGLMREAAPYLEHAIARGIHSFGDTNEVVRGRIATYAIYLLDTAQYNKAEPMLRMALTPDSESQSKTAKQTASLVKNALGRLLLETDRPHEALPLLESAALMSETFGATHPAYVVVAGNFARALAGVGRRSEALDLFRKTVETIEANGLTIHARIHRVFMNYAAVCAEMGLQEQAQTLSRKADIIKQS